MSARVDGWEVTFGTSCRRERVKGSGGPDIVGVTGKHQKRRSTP